MFLINQPIPPIRADVQLYHQQIDGEVVLCFYDSLGYAAENIVLNADVQPILNLINGRFDALQIQEILGDKHKADEIVEIAGGLDELGLLYSPNFMEKVERIESHFEEESRREASCAGSTYPFEADSVRQFLFNAFDKASPVKTLYTDKVKALYAPHIDYRVNMDIYAQAFSTIKHQKPKRVIMLGTSHYAGLYPDTYQDTPFIATKKHFETPLGTIQTDRTFIDNLMRFKDDIGLTIKDRAHRVEHSLELHALLLQYIWSHDFEIVPILVSSFDELLYSNEGALAKKVDRFAAYLSELGATDDDTLFLISGDLAHVGKKFGDPEAANDFKDDVMAFDKTFLDKACLYSAEGVRNHMISNYDEYRICGYPPLYTFLKMGLDLPGQLIAYDRWDESERESAVSFATIAY